MYFCYSSAEDETKILCNIPAAAEIVNRKERLSRPLRRNGIDAADAVRKDPMRLVFRYFGAFLRSSSKWETYFSAPPGRYPVRANSLPEASVRTTVGTPSML